MMLRWIPNIITTLRIILVMPFVWLFVDENYRASFYVFIVAGLSDFVDGMLARQFAWTTRYGAIMDPLADKLLLVSAFVLLAWAEKIPLWFLGIVIARDLIIVSGVAIVWYVCGGVNVRPSFISKTNTVLQILLVVALLYELAFYGSVDYSVMYLMGIVAITSVLSVLGYIVAGTRLVIARDCATNLGK